MLEIVQQCKIIKHKVEIGYVCAGCTKYVAYTMQSCNKIATRRAIAIENTGHDEIKTCDNVYDK